MCIRDRTRLGQYRVDGEIGRGSMGVVYRAQHLLLGRPAALKLLAGDLVDATSRARFEREVRLAAKLQHPSIVAVYDFGVTTEGLFFYAMELLDGVTGRELVADGPIPVPRAGAFVRQIAEALREAHDKQIVHRDLAPANLMITVRGPMPKELNRWAPHSARARSGRQQAQERLGVGGLGQPAL